MKKFTLILLICFVLFLNKGHTEPIGSGPIGGGAGAAGAAGVEDDVYGAGWNGDTLNAPSQNAVYDKIETLGGGDHGGLLGLADDDHSQYALLVGRLAGQTLIGGTATTADLTLQTTSGVGAAGADMHFLVGNNGGTEAMTILNSGNVGIGTDSPGTKLDVDGHVYVNDRVGHRTDTNTYVWFTDTDAISMIAGGATIFRIQEAAQNYIRTEGGNDVDVYFGPDASRFFIEGSSGNVGIGETSPSQALDLIGSLELEATTSSTTGVIYKGANRFIHDYTPAGADGYNTFVGVGAGNFTMAISGSSSHASYNTAIGHNAGNAITTGYNNSFFGRDSGASNTTGNSNSFFGRYSGRLNTTGNSNSFFGMDSGRLNTTGYNNSFFGIDSGYSNTIGASNLSIGGYSNYYNQEGSYNVLVGVYAGSGTSGHNKSNNTMLGYRAGYITQDADNNILIGYQAGDNLTTGDNNIVIGYNIDTPAVGTSNYLSIGDLVKGDLSGKILTIDGGLIAEKVDAGAANYNPSALTDDYIITVDTTAAPRSVIISTEDRDSGTAANPRIFIIKDIAGNAAANNITVSLETAGTIDGAANKVINGNYNSITLMVDGTNGYIL